MRILAVAGLSLGWALTAGCGDEAETPACEDECLSPPAAVCDGDTLTRFVSFGACVDGACVYDVASQTTCEQGCDAGACIEPECVDSSCRTPPAPSCDGSFAVRWSQRGACNDAQTSCEYEEADRTDCALDGRACVLGRCVEQDACDEEACAEIPDPFCDGSVRVATLTPGVCEPTERGEACVRPEATRTDCARDDQACVDGECVEILCDGPCLTPEPFCDGSAVVTPVGASFCDTTAGVCRSRDEVRTDCALSEQFCVNGACVDEVIDCSGVTCDAPPPSICVSSVVLETWTTPGTCDPDTGECAYEEVRQRCEAGQTCRDGACREDACTGVFCNEPPAPSCDGDVRVRWTDRGTCTGGTCTYASDRTDCTDSGRRCVDGACVTACEVDGCPAAPDSVCDGETATFFEGEGTCTAAGCVWSTSSLDCAAIESLCIEGDCVQLCDGELCDDPPADACTGTTAIRYEARGACSPLTGRCDYETTAENCALDDRVCIDGACVDDPCDTLECTTPPPRACSGNTVVEYFPGGACIDGACAWPERRTDCTESGASCLGGNCVGGCQPITCDEPPRPACDGRTAVRFETQGTCDDGTCNYPRIEEDCSVDFGFCSGGFCLPGECPTEGCGAPPAPLCNGNTVVSFTGPPACPSGSCQWNESAAPCGDDEQCLDGACIPINLCEGGCESPPEPFCAGDIARAPRSPGRCVVGECLYDDYDDRDCADEGLVCRGGDCVVDPCDGVACNAPPEPFCLGDVLQIPRAPGVCAEGTCRYFDYDEEDCNAVPEGICRDGACIVQEPCTITGCPDRDDYCDGDTLVRFTGSGFCDEQGKCEYDDVIVFEPCGEEERCVDAACVPAPFPGTGRALFSEVMITPDVDGISWIELFSPNEDPLSLDGWRLEITFDAATVGRVLTWNAPASATLEPFAFFVVADALPADFPASVSDVWGAWTTARFDLWDAEDTLVTRMEVDRETWPAHPAGTSLQVSGAVTVERQNDPAAWCPSAGLPPGPPRTPGGANGLCEGQIDE